MRSLLATLLLLCPCLMARADDSPTNTVDEAHCPIVCLALVQINGAPIAVLSNTYDGTLELAHRRRYDPARNRWRIVGCNVSSGVVTLSRYGIVRTLRAGEGAGDIPSVDIACTDEGVMKIIALYSELTGETMLPAAGTSGTVTIISSAPVPTCIAPDVLESALEMVGYTLVKLDHATKVVPLSGAARQPVRLGR